MTFRRSDVMSKGKKRSGARPGRPPPLRGTKGTRPGARLWCVGGQHFYLQGLLPLTLGYIVSHILTVPDRMPHALSPPGFLAGQLGRLITVSRSSCTA